MRCHTVRTFFVLCMFVMTYVIVIDMAYIIKSEWFHVFLRYLGEKSGLKSFKTKAQLEEVRKNVFFYDVARVLSVLAHLIRILL